MRQNLGLSDAIEYLKKKATVARPKKIIVFLEGTDDIDSFIELKNAVTRTDILCIATIPEVCFQLDKIHQQYKTIDEYFSIDDITEICMANFQRTRQFCKLIDDQIIHDYPVFKKFELKATMDNFQYMKLLFDQVSIKTRILEIILEIQDPTHIVTFGRKSADEISPHPFQYNEHMFDILLKQDRWNIDHLSIDNGKTTNICIPQKDEIPRVLPEIKKWIRARIPILYSALSVLQDHGLKKMICFTGNALWNKMKGKKTACIAGFGYEWDFIIPKLAEKSYSIVYWDTKWDNKKKEINNGILLSTKQFQKLCRFGSIDLTSFIFEKSYPRITEAITVAEELSQQIEAFFTRNKPQVLLCGTKSNFTDAIVAHIARANGIPVVSWQHGAAGFFSRYPIQEFTEVSGSDVHLVWGVEVKRQIDYESLSERCDVISTGSYSLEEIWVKNNRYKERVYAILYATTNYFYNSLYIGYSHRIQDIQFWNAQKTIINGMGFLNIPVCFKIHPSTLHSEHFQEYLQLKKITNISIIKNERSFSSLLENSDIIVIDFPSTTLLQAIASKKTLFVLLKFVVLTQEAKHSLKKRAYCYDEPDELVAALKKFLCSDDLDQHPNSENTEFFELYGICKKDGKVAERVTIAVDASLPAEN